MFKLFAVGFGILVLVDLFLTNNWIPAIFLIGVLIGFLGKKLTEEKR